MPPPKIAKPKFFPTPGDWRAWLEKNHAATEELWVGLYKRDSGRPSITWPESVDGALCFGWIDGVRYSIDAISYKIASFRASRGASGALSTSSAPPSFQN